MIVFVLFLCGCTAQQKNEEEAVLKVAVHDEAYKEGLIQLWKESYPETELEVEVVEPQVLHEHVMKDKEIDYDIFLLEDSDIPVMIQELYEVRDDVEVQVSNQFNSVFNEVKKVYLPLMGSSDVYYMLDIDKINQDHIPLDMFKSFEDISKLEHGFYYYDDFYYTFAFMTSNVNYFPGNDTMTLNFNGESFAQSLQDYRQIIKMIPTMDIKYYDNWFIQNQAYSGFVSDEMQYQEDAEVNGGSYKIMPLPSINGHALSTQATSYGYVINGKTKYPNASQNLLRLMHSIQGVQLLCENERWVPLILDDQINEFTFSNVHVKEKVEALNHSISRNWIGLKNRSEGAIDFLFLDSTIEKMKACDMKDIKKCQRELDEAYQEWLK